MKVLDRFAKNLAVPGRTTNGMHLARANGNGQDVFNPAVRQYAVRLANCYGGLPWMPISPFFQSRW